MEERECESLLKCMEGLSEGSWLGESSWTRVSRYFWNSAPCEVG